MSNETALPGALINEIGGGIHADKNKIILGGVVPQALHLYDNRIINCS